MKRTIVLIDGTWNDEGKGADTNVAKRDPENKSALRRLILAKSVTGTPQICHYYDGVGAEGDLLNRLLGGSIGLGLKKMVQDCYGFVVDDYEGWSVSQLLPYNRVILSPDAIHHGIFFNTRNPAEERINERVHWSVLAKRGRPCTYFGRPNTPYALPNLPSSIPQDKVATITSEERAMLP
jgi:Uncharacterized alpha/beta hydrolase domain (DUF2235)